MKSFLLAAAAMLLLATSAYGADTSYVFETPGVT